MKTLDKTMVEYIQELSLNISCISKYTSKTLRYANFLSQPLKLEMFVPCKDGVPLEEPEAEMCCSASLYVSACGCFGKPINEEWWVYQEAKEKVIFEGFIICDDSEYSYWITEHSTSTDLIFYKLKDRVDCFNDEIKTIKDLIPYKLKLTKEI